MSDNSIILKSLPRLKSERVWFEPTRSDGRYKKSGKISSPDCTVSFFAGAQLYCASKHFFMHENKNMRTMVQLRSGGKTSRKREALAIIKVPIKSVKQIYFFTETPLRETVFFIASKTSSREGMIESS